jgi:hypothetical protein
MGVIDETKIIGQVQAGLQSCTSSRTYNRKLEIRRLIPNRLSFLRHGNKGVPGTAFGARVVSTRSSRWRADRFIKLRRAAGISEVLRLGTSRAPKKRRGFLARAAVPSSSETCVTR